MIPSQLITKVQSLFLSRVLPILLLLSAFNSKAQSVTGSLGSDGSVGTMTISYTAGEAFVTTLDNGSIVLTQGFHQPSLVITAIRESFLPGSISVFPNPTAAVLNVRLEDLDLENITISLFDQAGRNILATSVDVKIWQTDLSNLPGGYYLLRVTDLKNDQSNSFKIFKSN